LFHGELRYIAPLFAHVLFLPLFPHFISLKEFFFGKVFPFPTLNSVLTVRSCPELIYVDLISFAIIFQEDNVLTPFDCPAIPRSPSSYLYHAAYEIPAPEYESCFFCFSNLLFLSLRLGVVLLYSFPRTSRPPLATAHSCILIFFFIGHSARSFALNSPPRIVPPSPPSPAALIDDDFSP